ncbi:MAG: processing protein, partial [Solirubrobacteraceae bacterium]|nr:processing protein [Solirubrobacteraceae bacterium]
MTAHACDDCLRRAWLIARLAGAIELARHQKRSLRQILALADDDLIGGLGRRVAPEIPVELERLDV